MDYNDAFLESGEGKLTERSSLLSLTPQFLGAVGGAAGPVKAATMALRPGIRSRVELPPAPVIDSDYNQHGIKHGSMNVHIPVLFEDGVHWMARIKMEDYWPKTLRRAVAEKEVVTLQALHSVAPEFVPNAWMPPNVNPSELWESTRTRMMSISMLR